MSKAADTGSPPTILPLGLTLSTARGRLSLKIPQALVWRGGNKDEGEEARHNYMRRELARAGWTFANHQKAYSAEDTEENRAFLASLIERSAIASREAHGPRGTEEIPAGVVRKSSVDLIEYIFSHGSSFLKFDPIHRGMGGGPSSQNEAFNKLMSKGDSKLTHEGGGNYKVFISKSLYFTFTSADRREVYGR